MKNKLIHLEQHFYVVKTKQLQSSRRTHNNCMSMEDEKVALVEW